MKTCPSCQHPNPELAKFCNHCGARLKNIGHSASQKSTPARSAERRQLTILFCDLVGSTPLSEQLDPEEFRLVITEYHQVAEGVIQLFGGHVAQYLGDGLLVYFGYPKGLEDAPRAAVRAGLGILDAMEKSNTTWESQGRLPVKVRIGIHTGLVVVDEHLALGETVNVAARLEGMAPHNGLVISPQTKELAEGWFEFKSLGEQTPKGISKPMELFQVLRETEAKTRLDIAKGKGLSPLVGRNKQLDLLQQLWEKTCEGKGQLALINGEAGIGKSRIIDQTEQMVNNIPGGKLLKLNGSAYHSNSAFYPMISMLQQEFLTGGDDERIHKITRLEKLIHGTSLNTQLYLPLMAEFLSLPPDTIQPPAMSPFAKRQIIMDGLCQLLENLAKSEPVLLVVEDLHWLDASTREWLQMWIKRPQNYCILTLMSTRPSFIPPWKDQEGIVKINLKRLQPDDIIQIVLHQTGGRSLPDVLIHQIEAKTEGVPLFVEELTKMITHSDLVEEREGTFILREAPNDLAIPSTLQDSLLARLDQLSESREIVLMSSVIGRSFSYDLLHAITSESPEVLTSALEQLVNHEIFNQLEEDRYEFKHALIQDAAYSSLLKSERQQKHLHVAGILQRDFPFVVADHPESLAYHYTEGNQPVTALPLWLQAGQRASQQNAMSEAIAHLQKGIDMLEYIEDPVIRNELELDFRITLGGAYVVAYGFPHDKVREAFDQARTVAQESAVSPKLALILFNLLSYYMNTENYEAHAQLAMYVNHLAEDKKHGYWFQMASDQLVGGANVIIGDFAKAKPCYERIITNFRPELPFPWAMAPSGYLEIGAKAWLMICLQAMGLFKEAKELYDHHLEYAAHHRDSMTLYHIHTFPALYSLEAREWKSAEKIIDDYFPIVRAFGDPVFILTAEVYHAIAKGFQGDRDAFSKAVNLVNTCFEIGFKAFAVTVSSWIGKLYYNMEDYQGAIDWNDRILAHVNNSGSHVHTTELYRIKGLAKLALGHAENEVEALLDQARTMAIKQSARTYELRAATDLARMWHLQGKAEAAKQLLQSAYKWFPEDFSNADLQNAREVLTRLQA